MASANEYVDCSSNNPLPDVAAYAAAGHAKLSVKSTEGTGYHWYRGETVAKQAHAHGLRVEYYHWLRPDSAAKAQADYFVSCVAKTWKSGDNLMTDFEATKGVADGSDAQRADQLATFNARVVTELEKPRVYTGNWYLDGKPHMQAECRVWDIVMSDYDNVDQLPNPHGLRYVAWQFTDTADVPGFTGHVDYNRLLVPDATPADLPAPVLRGDDTMPKILLVNQKDCAKHKLAWPGYFLCDGFTLQHIATVPKLHTLLQIGLKQQTISVAQYRALGGK